MGPTEPPRPQLELEDVHKAFGSVIVADGLSLRVRPGEMLGIVGPNGAGKTSVLNLISGHLAPDGGRIVMDGTEITRLPADRRARLGVGRTFQVPRPFAMMSVFENVLLGATFVGHARRDGRAADALAVETLAATGLLDRANVVAGALPLLDRKRLELARALALEPRLLLLDEIAGGLTEAEVEILIDLLGGLHERGMTIVWIEHIVAALLTTVDRLVAMDDGRILAEGDPRTVLADPAVQAVYLGREAEA